MTQPAQRSFAPAAKRMVEEHKLDPAQISGSGRDGRVSKADVIQHLAGQAGTAAGPGAARSRLPNLPAAGKGPAKYRRPLKPAGGGARAASNACR
jgi:2-oxoglutarate dehydrogenase E2 component (dihydrolipoamide succinyltransferase)